MTPLQSLMSATQQPYLPAQVTLFILGQGGSYGLDNVALQSPYGARMAPASRRRHTAQKTSSKRQVELEWRRANSNVLSQYAGQWVVLERNQIKGVAASLGEAVRLARASGVATPYVFRVEIDDRDVATFGL
jgi:hypothetical protein